MDEEELLRARVNTLEHQVSELAGLTQELAANLTRTMGAVERLLANVGVYVPEPRYGPPPRVTPKGDLERRAELERAFDAINPRL